VVDGTVFRFEHVVSARRPRSCDIERCMGPMGIMFEWVLLNIQASLRSNPRAPRGSLQFIAHGAPIAGHSISGEEPLADAYPSDGCVAASDVNLWCRTSGMVSVAPLKPRRRALE
jgi:hypothetical protein